MKSIIKNFLFITLFFLILLIIFVGYKLYNRISIANERIDELELFKTSYQNDKKLHQLEIEKIYLTEVSKIRINKYNYEFKKFQLSQKQMFPAGYIDIYENKLFFISGDGNIFF